MNQKVLNIVEKKNLWFLISLIIISLGFFLIGMKAVKSEPLLNYGIDFVGGSSLLIKSENLSNALATTPENAASININTIEKVRSALKSLGLEKNTIQITQNEEIIIKTLQLDHHASETMMSALNEQLGEIELLEVDFIGPTISQELRQKSIWIILTVMLTLLIYISWRFDLYFGFSAIAALLHDGLVMISLARILNIEINTIFVAAFLTILGYSINDTIILFDRIRENIPKKLTDEAEFRGICNLSVMQTLTRTILTSLTTLLVVSSLLIFGGTTIKTFCLVLIIGIIAGTYSSVFIASPVLTMLYKPTEVEEIDA